jgi:hypothetical protein
MSEPGTKSPPRVFPKNASGESKLPEPNAKTVDEEKIRFNGGVADIGTAPVSRVYTRDYQKKGRDSDDTDFVTAALGEPVFRI